MIEGDYLYAKGNGTDTITLAYTPQPGMGPILTSTITPGTSWGWCGNALDYFWNYDSCFIYVLACGPSVSFAYDVSEPYDGRGSPNGGQTWMRWDARLWVRLALTMETVGDLPVSGTINTIAVPNLTSGKSSGLITVPAGGTYYMEVAGAGSLLIAYFFVTTSAATQYLKPSILCDGAEALPAIGTFNTWKSYLVELAHSDIYIGQWNTTDNWYTLVVALPLKFRRSLKVGLKNDGTSDYYAGLYFTYELIS
jgi:hypothetical protein